MKSQESRRTKPPLAVDAGGETGDAQPTEAIIAAWRAIDTVLTPIVGERGVEGLCRRSLALTSATYPWLASTRDGVNTAIDPDSLESVLAQQAEVDAAAGGTALLRTFYELLTTLVGPSLTEQLLRPVWANGWGGAPPPAPK